MNTPVRDKDDFLVFGAPLIEDAEIQEVVATLTSGWLGTGPKVKAFEAAMAGYKGAKHAIAVNSCTAALHLSLVASGIGPGDEVITTPMTFCATINAIIHSGATPVLADVDPETFNIDPARIEEKITPRTKAILPVHFAGRVCDMQALGELVRRHNLLLIEDCAHAIESTQDQQHAGTFGKLGCFSFYVTKNVVTGEGGMILTDDDDYAERLRVLSLHGMSKDAYKRFGNEGFKHYDVVEAGFKYNMMDLQAAIGLHQLNRVEEAWQRREQVWQIYQNELPGLGLKPPPAESANAKHAYHLLTVLIDKEQHGMDRDTFLDEMTRQGIGVGVHYLSVPGHTYYQETLGWRPEDYPNAQYVGDRTISLPISAKLTDADVADVLESIRRVMNRA